MKAVLVDQESNLSWGEADRPQINADEILVKVHATAINRADLMPVSYTHLTLPTNREV